MLIGSGSAADLVVLADTRPPALELAGQELTLWAVDVTALKAGRLVLTYLDYLDCRRSEGQTCMGSNYMAVHLLC